MAPFVVVDDDRAQLREDVWRSQVHERYDDRPGVRAD